MTIKRSRTIDSRWMEWRGSAAAFGRLALDPGAYKGAAPCEKSFATGNGSDVYKGRTRERK